MRVIGSGGTEKGRKLVLAEGAHHVIDHTIPGHLDEILTLTEGSGADIILEMLANVNLGLDLKALALNGRVLIIGSRGRVEVDPRDAMRREAAVLGVYLYNMTQREKGSTLSALGAGLENRSLRPIVGKEMPLADAPRSHREVMQPGAFSKIVLAP
jgi:NADPH2:quinone reductase